MTRPSRPSADQARDWMAQWRHAAIALAQVRADEVRSADVRVVAAQLEDATVAAIRRGPAATSGLVEQQRLFHRRQPQ